MAEPGWYVSPNEPGLMRWWDGSQWTVHTQAVPDRSHVEPAPTMGPGVFSQAMPLSAPFGTVNLWRKNTWVSGMDFSVGMGERHSVSFSFDKFWGPVTISVDGQRRIRKILLFSFSLKREWGFPVGNQELHQVRITMERKLAFAGVRPQLVQAYVDNVLVGQYEA